VAGALTERDFVTKLERAGFTEVEILEGSPMGVDDCALYPLFTAEVLDLMRSLIPPERQQTIGTAIVVRARLDREDPTRQIASTTSRAR
jgi:hypothetical protein